MVGLPLDSPIQALHAEASTHSVPGQHCHPNYVTAVHILLTVPATCTSIFRVGAVCGTWII